MYEKQILSIMGISNPEIWQNDEYLSLRFKDEYASKCSALLKMERLSSAFVTDVVIHDICTNAM